MIIDVWVKEYRHRVTAHEIGLTRDRHTISTLRQRYAPDWFLNPIDRHMTADFTAPPGFQRYVDKYSEATTQEPWRDIESYFQKKNRIGSVQNPQGLMSYPVSYPRINTAALASSGEALAGWFCETHYNWDLYIRPPMVTPDLIFRRSRTSRRLALVEVKSSGNLGNPISKMTGEMINLLRVLAPTKLLRPGRYYVGLIMVQVESPTEVRLTSLILEEA